MLEKVALMETQLRQNEFTLRQKDEEKRKEVEKIQEFWQRKVEDSR